MLNLAHSPVIPASEFTICLRIRLGAHFLEECMICPACGTQILERTCAHAFCCAPGESTKGHYKARDEVLNLCHLSDASAVIEAPELIPSAPTLRPADILTSAAIPGCRAALDIGICSPDASGANDDCCESMRRRKLDVYASYLHELGFQGIRYVPMIFSCYGRLHPETAHIISYLAGQAAKRFGINDASALERRCRAALGVAIWRRAAAMIYHCLPPLSPECAALLFGEASDDLSPSSAAAAAAAASTATAACPLAASPGGLGDGAVCGDSRPEGAAAAASAAAPPAAGLAAPPCWAAAVVAPAGRRGGGGARSGV